MLMTSDDDLRKVRASVAAEIIQVMDRRKISPQQAQRLTGSQRPDFSRLRNGRLERFTLDRLVKILGLLDRDIEVSITYRARSQGEH
jgi:predicted XRE-type DNA-binding protein